MKLKSHMNGTTDLNHLHHEQENDKLKLDNKKERRKKEIKVGMQCYHCSRK
jgi:hypothetical protein